MVADGIKGLDTVIGEKFPGTPLQRCVTHLKRNMFAKVRHRDKAALTANLRDIFRTGQRDYTIEMTWTRWQEMCDRWGKVYRAIKLLRRQRRLQGLYDVSKLRSADTGDDIHNQLD